LALQKSTQKGGFTIAAEKQQESEKSIKLMRNLIGRQTKKKKSTHQKEPGTKHGVPPL